MSVAWIGCPMVVVAWLLILRRLVRWKDEDPKAPESFEQNNFPRWLVFRGYVVGVTFLCWRVFVILFHRGS